MQRRHLVSIISIIALTLYPKVLFSLDLGDLNVHSYLNQPLAAEIALLKVDSEQLDRIKVTPASRRHYQRAGITLMPHHESVELHVTQNAEGKPVIWIASNEPVDESLVELLFEVSWPNGSLLDQYSIQLAEVPEWAMNAPTEAAIEKPEETEEMEVTQPNSQAPQFTQVSRAEFDALLSDIAQERTTDFSGNYYGPVSREDTLWHIARKFREERSETASVQKIMLAFLDKNQTAFANQNINQLQAGSFLTLPSSDEIQGYSDSDTFTTVKAQNEYWYSEPTVTLSELSTQIANVQQKFTEVINEAYTEISSLRYEIESVPALQEEVANLQAELVLSRIELDNVKDDTGMLGEQFAKLSAYTDTLAELVAAHEAESALRYDEINSTQFTLTNTTRISPLILLAFLLIAGVWVFQVMKKLRRETALAKEIASNPAYRAVAAANKAEAAGEAAVKNANTQAGQTAAENEADTDVETTLPSDHPFHQRAAATQLDLARAYIDMDDKKNAAEILKEVIAQGDKAERKEAEQLLKRI